MLRKIIQRSDGIILSRVVSFQWPPICQMSEIHSRFQTGEYQLFVFTIVNIFFSFVLICVKRPYFCQFNNKYKPGGLDSRDQSRSISRMSLVSRLTFLQCWDFLDGRDRPFFSRSRFLKSRLFNWDLAASRFSSRLSRFLRFVKIFKICWDFSRFIEISQHYWDFLRYFTIKNLNKLRNLDWEIG
jgi:hypothetical protein